MSQPPEGPEYYSPPPQASVPIPPPPPSISDAAAQYGVAQASDGTYEYVQNPAYNMPRTPRGPSKPQGLAIGALTVGIIALVTGWIPVWGILLGIVAVILGAVALAKKQSKGMSITGIVTGFLGAVLSGVVLAVILAGAGWLSDPDNWYTYDPGATYDAGASYFWGEPTPLGPDAGDASLAVVEQAFGPLAHSDGAWWFVVILNNPNDTAFARADITVQALAADGTVIDSNWSYRDVGPGKIAIVGNFWEVGDTAVDSLAVLGPPAEALSDKKQSAAVEVGELTVEVSEWSTTVSGTGTATGGDIKYGAAIAIVARDSGGTIVAASAGYVRDLKAGESQEFQVYFFDELPDGVTYEAYAWPY